MKQTRDCELSAGITVANGIVPASSEAMTEQLDIPDGDSEESPASGSVCRPQSKRGRLTAGTRSTSRHYYYGEMATRAAERRKEPQARPACLLACIHTNGTMLLTKDNHHHQPGQRTSLSAGLQEKGNGRRKEKVEKLIMPLRTLASSADR